MELYDVAYPLESDKLTKLFQYLERCQNKVDFKSIIIVSSHIIAKSIETLISNRLNLKHIKVMPILNFFQYFLAKNN
jgi:hypothetical protein